MPQEQTSRASCCRILSQSAEHRYRHSAAELSRLHFRLEVLAAEAANRPRYSAGDRDVEAGPWRTAEPVHRVSAVGGRSAAAKPEVEAEERTDVQSNPSVTGRRPAGSSSDTDSAVVLPVPN